METVLSPRLKNIGCACLAVLLAGAAFYCRIFLPRNWSNQKIEAQVKKNSAAVEKLLAAEIQANLLRSDALLGLFRRGRLSSSNLGKNEALVQVKNGVIVDYVGEIYFFKAAPLAEGRWLLLKKNQELYFYRRLEGQTYYLRHFLNLKSNPVRRAWKYPCALLELKFSQAPLTGGGALFSYDQAQQRFYFSHRLKASQNQLIIDLIFSHRDFSRYLLKRNSLLSYGFVFFMFLLLFLCLARRTWLRLPALAGMAAAAWFFIAWLVKADVYFPQAPLRVQSVWQLLVVLIFLLLLNGNYFRGRARPNNVVALVLFNLLALAAIISAAILLGMADFSFAEFSFHPPYLGLLALLVGLHFMPLLLAGPWLLAVSPRRGWPLVLVQAALLLVYSRLASHFFFSLALLALLFIVWLCWGSRFWARILTVVLLALSISHFLSHGAQRELRGFVDANLKNIFSSQNHYAKLVAREIVYEINSRKMQFFEFFRRDVRGELEKVWNNTLAAREAIASGIYVVSGDGERIHSHSYQMPYIDIVKKDIFPFWHVEAIEADLFGKKVNLAVATINVFQRERYIGYIMVQVMNSADLIMRSRGPASIFDLDRRIVDAGLSYLKVAGEGGILENPANINVENLAVLLKKPDSWVAFRAMGVDYNGYVFKSGDESIIIFFPSNTFFKTFSQYIRILLAMLLLAAAFYTRQLKALRWRLVFQSFSLKVFTILVLLSMLTAVVFAVFSLNFNSLALDSQQQQGVYARGRSALNIINNLLAESGEITQNHMFLLGKILENDIHVYENGTLLFTSNHRKFIHSQLPVYLDTGIRDSLRQNNQQFHLHKTGKSLGLYFKTGNGYIFNIEYASNSANLIRSRQYYFDFLISVFFILFVIGMMAAFYFRNKILAPIHLLNRGMAEVQQGRLQPLQDIPSESELRDLVQGFNSMLQGIQEQKKNVSEIARMKTLVELGRRVAHEVKNPLTPIKLSAEQILRSLQDAGGERHPVIAKAVRFIIEETEHLQRVAYGFLNLSKLDELHAAPFILNDLVEEEVANLRPIYTHVQFTVRAERPRIDVKADRLKIKQVIANILSNSLEAIGSKPGRVDLGIGEQGAMIAMTIRDNGKGMGQQELAWLRQENYSSKSLGTGLGLVIARRFLELHCGGLEIESHPEEGTTLFLRFAKDATQA